MAIDERFIDELNARCDIVDIVSRYVSLKKSGSNYFGLCPFHNEKTASFSVAPDKQIFYCFGCGAGGGPIRFIMNIEGLEFQDAVRYLAKQYNMTVPETNTNPKARHRRERVLAALKDAARFFYTQLHSPAGAQALAYFQRRRLAKRTLNNFGLGFAPDSFHALLDAMTEKGYSKEELEAAGLIVRSEKGTYYDKFRNRVMFPIIDIRGDVIGFGGRVMDDSKPKYLNSPETMVFNKRRNLFAMNIAKKTKSEYFLLAEGYMDVIALHQAGFDCAVASLGTSLTDEQARLLTRYTKTVIVCYDADAAGQAASQRAIDILKKAGLRVRILRIPGAKDPDEFIKEKGAEAFRKLIERSDNDVRYRIEAAREKYDFTEDDQRILFLREAAGIIAALENSVERDVYTASTAKLAGVTQAAFAQEVAQALTRQARQRKRQMHREVRAPAQAAQPRERNIHYDNVKSARAEEGLLALLFSDSSLAEEMRDKIAPEDFSSPVLGKIYGHAIALYDSGRSITVSALEGTLAPEEIELLVSALRTAVSPDQRIRAMEDYIDIIAEQKAARDIPGEAEEDPLLRKAQMQRKTKRYDNGAAG
ncbi:MAG: DNA primase [Eubacteriales bacterium]|nr:DNA primase [Eubacteriales bacterium]